MPWGWEWEPWRELLMVALKPEQYPWPAQFVIINHGQTERLGRVLGTACREVAMAHKLLCQLGLHRWRRTCWCARCEKTRDFGHDWSRCTCARCGMYKYNSREQGFRDNGRHEEHTCKCSYCGRILKDAFRSDHKFAGCKCTICGYVNPLGSTFGSAPNVRIAEKPVSGMRTHSIFSSPSPSYQSKR